MMSKTQLTVHRTRNLLLHLICNIGKLIINPLLQNKRWMLPKSNQLEKCQWFVETSDALTLGMLAHYILQYFCSSRCTRHWRIQQPMMIEQCFNFWNTLSMCTHSFCIIRIYPHWKNVVICWLKTTAAYFTGPITTNSVNIALCLLPDLLEMYIVSPVWSRNAICPQPWTIQNKRYYHTPPWPSLIPA